MTNSKNLHLSGEREDAQAAYAHLVREAAAGDPDAMERLLMKAQETAYRVSLLVCGDPADAEDVMQEALLKTYQYVSRIQKPEAFRTWLYRTVRNACLMKRRRRVDEPARHVSVEQGGSAEGDGRRVEVVDTAPAADERLIDASVGERIRAALAALPRPYRAIVVLREIEGLSTREVATVTKLSEANVKTRLHRARGLLRQHLGDV